MAVHSMTNTFSKDTVAILCSRVIDRRWYKLVVVSLEFSVNSKFQRAIRSCYWEQFQVVNFCYNNKVLCNRHTLTIVLIVSYFHYYLLQYLKIKYKETNHKE